jgi:hypothetical protein
MEFGEQLTSNGGNCVVGRTASQSQPFFDFTFESLLECARVLMQPRTSQTQRRSRE